MNQWLGVQTRGSEARLGFRPASGKAELPEK